MLREWAFHHIQNILFNLPVLAKTRPTPKCPKKSNNPISAYWFFWKRFKLYNKKYLHLPLHLLLQLRPISVLHKVFDVVMRWHLKAFLKDAQRLILCISRLNYVFCFATEIGIIQARTYDVEHHVNDVTDVFKLSVKCPDLKMINS